MESAFVPSPQLTIAYMTFRLRPRFEWFARSLARELRAMPDVPREAVQIMVIDGRLWWDPARGQEIITAAEGRIGSFEHYAPKPTVWQGPTRLSKKDFFCASNARNTALVMARGKHVAFVDDLSVLLPGWLKAHWHALQHAYVLCGSTCKNKEIQVNEEGNVVSFQMYPPGQDSRLRAYGPGLRQVTGNQLFGGTFSVPLKLALDVDGLDEICDTIGGEDYDFGVRLERMGGRIFYSGDSGTFEDEDGHHTEAPMVRLDKVWKGPDGPYSSNYLLNRLMRETGRVRPLGNLLGLRWLRKHVLEEGNAFPDRQEPKTHWVDGQKISEMPDEKQG